LVITSSLPLPLFFPYSPPTYFYTLSLHDALPISARFFETRFRLWIECALRLRRRPDLLRRSRHPGSWPVRFVMNRMRQRRRGARSESTRLNSSHQIISYAVFCLKKKKQKQKNSNK